MSLLGGNDGSGEREVNSDAEAFARIFLSSFRPVDGIHSKTFKVTRADLLSTLRIGGARTGVAARLPVQVELDHRTYGRSTHLC
jgi:hypothetical protein